MAVPVGLAIVHWIGSEMNKDRFAGAAETLGGSAMASVGNLLGDAELERRGRKHRRDGKIRNILGSIREIVGFDAQPAVGTATSTKLQEDKVMNEDEIKGGVRYVKGKIEKGAGDITTDTKWQVDGLVDQVAGGAQNLYGRAKERVQDAIDDAPAAFADASDKVRDAAQQGRERVLDATHQGREKARELAQQGRAVASEQAKQNPWALVAAACVVGYALSWLVHGKRV